MRSDGQRQADWTAHPVATGEIEPPPAARCATVPNDDRRSLVSLVSIAPANGRVASLPTREAQLEVGAGAYDETPFSEEPGGRIVRTGQGRLQRLAHARTRGERDDAQHHGHPLGRGSVTDRLATRQRATRARDGLVVLCATAATQHDRSGGYDGDRGSKRRLHDRIIRRGPSVAGSAVRLRSTRPAVAA
jgi:hypothetical protein